MSRLEVVQLYVDCAKELASACLPLPRSALAAHGSPDIA